MDIKTINSVKEYVEAICELNRNRNDLLNEEFLFRGQSNVKWKLEPSLVRLRSDSKGLVNSDATCLKDELSLIEMAKYKLPEIFKNDMLPLDILALLQHHLVPTRLLDLTENALVALYFACEIILKEKKKPGDKEPDGEVFVFHQYDSDIATYPIIQAIADSSHLIRSNKYPLDFFFQSASNMPYFASQRIVYDICFSEKNKNKSSKNKSPFMSMEDILSGICHKPIFVYAPIRTMRQKTQSGRYLLFPNRIHESASFNCKVFDDELVSLEKDDPCIACRFTISGEAKQSILDDLNTLGICREILFWDNIDVVCQEIKKTISLRQ